MKFMNSLIRDFIEHRNMTLKPFKGIDMYTTGTREIAIADREMAFDWLFNQNHLKKENYHEASNL